MTINWETFPLDEDDPESSTERYPVPGGWIVRTSTWSERDDQNGQSFAVALCYVPDPDHLWDLHV